MKGSKHVFMFEISRQETELDLELYSSFNSGKYFSDEIWVYRIYGITSRRRGIVYSTGICKEYTHIQTTFAEGGGVVEVGLKTYGLYFNTQVYFQELIIDIINDIIIISICIIIFMNIYYMISN